MAAKAHIDTMASMTNFDYGAPADLFTSRHRSKRAALKYHRFDSCAEAIRYAVEDVPADAFFGSVIEVGDVRLDANAIKSKYEDSAFPLKRSATRASAA